VSDAKKGVRYDRPRYVDAMERRVRNATSTVGRVDQELSNSAAHGAARAARVGADALQGELMETRTLLPVHPALRVVDQAPDGYAAVYRHLRFIVSAKVEGDGKLWLHASVSRRDKTMPSYDDLRTTKRLCIGDDRTALQVFPPADKHIDIAGPRGIEVLHLWSCLSGDVTPDFSAGI